MRQKLYSGETLVGTLEMVGNGILFEYDSDWIEGGFPLSFNLPLASGPKRMSADAFVRNLFPEEKRRNFISRFGKISPDFVIPFLRLYGDDLPGAINIRPSDGNVAEKDITDIAARLVARHLPLDMLGGRISLAGADPKAGVIARDVDGECRLFMRTGTSFSTHILKATESLAEAEAMGMEVARLAGLPVCGSRLISLKGNPAYLVERYDRRIVGGRMEKIQQEDFCQRLGISENEKYLNDRNGMVTETANVKMASVVNGLCASDRDMFLRASIFNIIFGNTDDHAKNYSLLFDGDGWRLAPFYDIISSRTLKKAFPEWNNLSPQLSRPFGRSILPAKVTHRDFSRHAEIFGIDAENLVDMWIDVCQRTIRALDGFAGHFMSSCVPCGLDANRLRDVERLADVTERHGGKFARSMLDIGLRAKSEIAPGNRPGM